MTQGPESKLTKQILDYLRSLPEAHAVKVHGGPYGNAGEPDITACVAGRAVHLEVKVGRNKPSPTQLASLARWRKAGALAEVVYSLEDVKVAIATLTQRKDN